MPSVSGFALGDWDLAVAFKLFSAVLDVTFKNVSFLATESGDLGGEES